MTIRGMKSKKLSVIGGENAQTFISTTTKNYVRRIADSEEKISVFFSVNVYLYKHDPGYGFGQHRYISGKSGGKG